MQKSFAQNKLQWSLEEDALLRLLVRDHMNEKNWSKIADMFNQSSDGLFRSDQQCRERYKDVLDPKLDLEKSRAPWTQEEKEILRSKVLSQQGEISWSKISLEAFNNQKTDFQCSR